MNAYYQFSFQNQFYRSDDDQLKHEKGNKSGTLTFQVWLILLNLLLITWAQEYQKRASIILSQHTYQILEILALINITAFTYRQIITNLYKQQQSMSSFKDMINSKFNNSKGRPDVQLAKTYDQSWLKITPVGGQTQLCPIKLNCAWANPSVVTKPPILNCKWFSKTDISLTEIQGILGTYYQPTLNDVGSKIQIQCFPELEGIEYEGMPITVDVGPIKIDPETEEEASDFQQTKRATFFIKIKKMNAQDFLGNNGEGLIKISQNILKIVSRTINKQQKQLCSIQINQQYPQLTIYPISPKQLLLTAHQNTFTLQFNNNKIRDVFILLIRLISAHINDSLISQPSNTQRNQTAMRESEDEKVETVQSSQKMEKEESKSEGKSQKKSEPASLEHLEERKIGSSDEFKHVAKNENLNHSSIKRNTQQLLQMNEIKKKMREYEGQIYSLKKMIQDKDMEIEQLKQKANQIQQRSNSLNRNYFELENQLKEAKRQSQAAIEQLSYFRNENKILKSENEKQQKKIRMSSQRIAELEDKLAPFLDHASATYQELKASYQDQAKIRKQLQAKCEYLNKDRQEFQEKWLQFKESIHPIQEERDYFKKKFENLSAELQNLKVQSQLIQQSQSQIKSTQNSTDLQNNSFAAQDIIKHLESEILSLKKQLKESIEESDFLRTINISSKDKKSSKTQLKHELIETKKIVNRLTQNITEKDLAIFHLKQVNKGLSQQIEGMKTEINKLKEESGDK